MKYHLIGIKGAGMSALANILREQGHTVTGSDIDTHDKNHIQEDMIVIRSRAIKDDNVEMQEVFRLGLENYTYPEFLGHLTNRHHTIGICGCHGKTSTTAMLSHIFDDTISCSYLIGDGTGHATANSQYFIIEACEYKRSFLNYYPTSIIITNIEYDHMDYYKTFSDMILAYQEFVNQTKDIVLAYGEDENIRKLDFTGKQIYYYGTNEADDFIAKNIDYHSSGTDFDVYFHREKLGRFTLSVVGKHMMLNAVASIAIGYLNHIPLDEMQRSLSTFHGAHKRFEETVVGDIISVLDYAHHPTEISVTIDSARQKYPEKEVVAILLPNTYSRTMTLKDDFVKALKKADTAYVMDIYCDREVQEDYPGITSDLIINELPNGHKVSVETADILLQHKNAVMLFMSCKHVDIIKNRYEELLHESKI